MSSFANIVFGEGITTFEALDRLSVPYLEEDLKSLQTQVDILDGNVRSLANTVDNQYRQTQNQISDINTIIRQLQLDVQSINDTIFTLRVQINTANVNSQNALTTANSASTRADSAWTLASSFETSINSLKLETQALSLAMPRFIRPGNVIRLYYERDESRSFTSTRIFPLIGEPHIWSGTQYMTSTDGHPTVFIQPLILTGAGDNSRYNVSRMGPRYPIREGAVQFTFGDITQTTLAELRFVSDTWSSYVEEKLKKAEEKQKQLEQNE